MGFLRTGLNSPYEILPDYSIPFFGETAISTILAGAVGVILLFSLLLLLGRSLRRKENT
jgi:cobalt/nickel transport system permease protein